MRIKITDFDIQISAENVCAFLDADKTGELYEEIMDELKEMIPTAYEKIRPVALLGFGSMEGYPVRADGQEIREALFGVYSIGKEMERWSTDLFAAGDYLGGMLVDAMADYYLFQMDEDTIITAASLSQWLNITSRSCNRILQQLLDSGLIEEIEPQKQSGKGRPTRQYQFLRQRFLDEFF